MLYGEGDNAFLRLQEETIKRSDDMSIFLGSAPRRLSLPIEVFSLGRLWTLLSVTIFEVLGNGPMNHLSIVLKMLELHRRQSAALIAGGSFVSAVLDSMSIPSQSSTR